MRRLREHEVGGLNEVIEVYVLDEPGSGGACHEYEMRFGPAGPLRVELKQEPPQIVKFQKGPIGETGPNGTSNEALLAILIDRMVGFQSGEFYCNDNALALQYLRDALSALQKRTRERLARGVQGTSEK